MCRMGTFGLCLSVLLLAGCGEKEVVREESYYFQNTYQLKNKLMECKKNPVKKDARDNQIHRLNCERAQAVAFVLCIGKMPGCSKLETYITIDRWTLGIF